MKDHDQIQPAAAPVRRGTVEGRLRKLDKPSKTKSFGTDIFHSRPLDPGLVRCIQELESLLKRRVLLVLQDDHTAKPEIALDLARDLLVELQKCRARLPKERIAILLDSPGGDAQAAFQIAMLIRKVCGGYSVVIPRYAKSAATLLALGADEVVMGNLAEIGPLDVQHRESLRKEFRSALNEKQSVERLHTSALEAVDRTALFVAGRLRLRGDEIEEFLPLIMEYVSDEFRPLFEKLDVVHWAQVSRLLKIGEDYAERLLKPKYSAKDAKSIAHTLVEAYPDHGFVIDDEEARSIGLDIRTPDREIARVVDELYDRVDTVSAIGFLKELEGK
jgi:hypothetical protein